MTLPSMVLVRGRVVGFDGPLSEFTVNGRFNSDEKGRFREVLVSPNHDEIMINAKGYRPKRMALPRGKRGPIRLGTILLTSAQPQAGRVVSSVDGTPVFKAAVGWLPKFGKQPMAVEQADGDGNGWARIDGPRSANREVVHTDREGRFSFRSGLPSGANLIVKHGSFPTQVFLSDGDNTDWTLGVQLGGALKGRVVGAELKWPEKWE